MQPSRSLACALLFASLVFTGAIQGGVPELTLTHGGDDLRIAVVGDAGLETDTIAGALTAVGRLDAILVVGDNFYPCGVRSGRDPKWHVVDPLTHLGIPLYVVLGNHDYCGNPAAEIGANVPNWNLPAREYAIRDDLADFAMLDTTPYAEGTSRSSGETVTDVFAHSHARWRIAVGHHVVDSSGWHSVFPRSEARRMHGLLPFLQKSGVDLYICGHDHHEELLAGRPFFLVSGAGSEPVPMITIRDETIWPRVSHLREPIGFAIVTIRAESMIVEFRDGNGHPSSPLFSIDHAARVRQVR